MLPTWAFAIFLGVVLGVAYVVVVSRRNGQREPNASGNVIERVEELPRRRGKQSAGDDEAATRRRRTPRPDTPDTEVMMEISRLIDAGQKAAAYELLRETSSLSVTDATARIDTWSVRSARRAARGGMNSPPGHTDY